MEWPSYQGTSAGIRRQHIVATQTPPPHGSGSSASSRLSSFHPILTQVALSYEIPPHPIHQLPGLEEETSDNAEVPLMSSADKIESTL